jgi:serine/threonine-protein kinase
MDRELWPRAVELFHAALDRPEAEQAEFVAAGSEGNPELRDAVLGMLDEDRRGVSRLRRGVAEFVGLMSSEFDSSKPFSPPNRIGPYQGEGFLGRGGMGAVWKYVRVDTGLPVAIKFLLLDGGLPEVRRRRFAQEIQTLAKLRHPHIVSFHDAGALEDGTPWFVMDFVEEHVQGARFTDYCREPGQPITERLRLFRVVCEAVLHAHQQGIIHRDLKPSNILIDRDGQPRVVDFGIARELQEPGERDDATSLTQRFMSPDYAAPEWKREGRVGVYTDVYSLGVILYEILTGQHPYRKSVTGRDSVGEDFTRKLPEKPSAVVRRALSAQSEAKLSRAEWSDLDKLCLTAMHPDPAERYRSVESLLRDVDHYLNHEPLDAQPGLLRYRTAKFVRRHRRGFATAAAALVLLAALIAGFTWRLARERNLAQAEAARVRSIQDFMTGLLQGGDEEAGPTVDFRVSAMIDRGIQQAGALGNDHRLQADLYQTLGTMAQKLGRLDQAEALLEKALDEHQSLAPADPAGTVSNRIALGLLRANKGNAKEGEQLARRALVEAQALRPANPLLLAESELALGTAMVLAGEQKDAVPVLRQAVAALQSLPSGGATQLGRAYAVLGEAKLYLGEYGEAETLYRQALAADRATYGDRHPHIAEDLGGIAEVLEVRGHYAEAEPLERQAVAIMQGWYGPDHPETARKMTTLASTLVYENKEAEADDLLGRALAIQERVYGDQHPKVAYVLNSIGSATLYERRYAEAERDFERVASIYRGFYGDSDYRVAVALGNLASVYQAEKRYPECERLLRDVVERFARSLGPANIQTGMAQVRLGRTLLQENKYDEAAMYSGAGYETLSKQTSSTTSFVAGSRHDLALEYVALGQPEKARQYSDPAAAR